ncbi:hypothetical protein C6W20_15380 [Bacillus sp. NMCN6]|nr:hypothetical protein C6W21_15745 [Bacillus sp. NMCN1]PRR97007.1 hypothetical protein C6W20_15380 [Bacillus sp. NMCN6]
MKKLMDSFLVTKVLLNEICHNLLSNNIFKKRHNRYLLLGIIVAVYIMYFYLNMSELNKIFINRNEVSNELRNSLFSSLTNMIIIITGVIYLIVTLSFSLTKKMQYLLKILPFEKGSIWFGSVIFKLLLSYWSFLIVFAIMIPMLRLFHYNIGLNFLILIYCQLLFVASICFYYLIFYSLSSLVRLNFFNINNGLLVLFLFLYYFSFRFSIDVKFQTFNIIVDHTLVVKLMLILCILIASFVLCINYLHTKIDNDIYTSNDFYIFKLPFNMQMNKLTLIILGTIRSRLTIRLLGVVFLVFLLSLFDTKNIIISLTTLAYIYPLISFTSIRYFNTTVSYRKMNSFFGVTSLKESFITTFMNFIINFPLVITSLILSDDFVKSLYYGVILFEAGLIMSIIFPKNKSSLNEFSASVLCIVMAVGLYLISNSVIIFVSVYLLLFSVKYYLLERSYLDEAA